MTGVTVERARQVLAGYREDLKSARIIAQHCWEQYDQADRDLSDAERRLTALLSTLEEREPEVWAQLTDDERERPS